MSRYVALRSVASLLSCPTTDICIMSLPADSVTVTCTAPVNIAVVKYWGKRDERLILPVNSSLSGTIHQDCMKSETTITASKSFERDQMWLNDEEEDFSKNKRMSAVIKELREAAQDYVAEDGRVLIRAADWPLYKLRIVSHNNFPTAAGLASSASGFACLTQSLASLYRASGDLSRIARQGSGSACRSMYGGWVQWIMGEKADGSDSIAAEVASAEHWPEMRVLIAVVSSGPKDVSSSSGMQQSVETSDLLKHRAAAVVPARMERMISAIERKDFPSFAVETIKDSNQFHAVCLDTYPPIFYMNDTSKRIVHLLDNINAHAPAPTVAYTFDAGPNAVIYLLNDQLESTLAGMLHAFQPAGTEYNSFVHDPMNLVNGEALQKAASALPAHVNALKGFDANGVRRIIVSKLGPGPIVTKQAHSFSA